MGEWDRAGMYSTSETRRNEGKKNLKEQMQQLPDGGITQLDLHFCLI